MPALIHTRLQPNTYRVREDSGIVRDSDALFATVAQSIVFRGSLEELHKRFKVGKVLSNSETRMLCSGPTGIKLFGGTAADPHWECDVQWVGIHQKIHAGGDPDFIYRVEDEFTRLETEFPKKFQNSAGLEYTLGINPPFVTEPVINPFTGGPKRSRLITFTPTKTVIGVLVSPIQITPAHPKIFQLIKNAALFGTPDISLRRDWWPDTVRGAEYLVGTPEEQAAAYAALVEAAKLSTYIPDPTWTWAVKYMEGGGDDGGAWVPASLQVRRQLSVGNLQAFTMTVAYEQRVQPG